MCKPLRLARHELCRCPRLYPAEGGNVIAPQAGCGVTSLSKRFLLWTWRFCDARVVIASMKVAVEATIAPAWERCFVR